MKKNDTSDSSQIYEPKDIQSIKEESNTKSTPKFIKVKKPTNKFLDQNKFIDRNTLRSKLKPTPDSTKLNISGQEEHISSGNFVNQELSDNDSKSDHTNLKSNKLNRNDSNMSDKTYDKSSVK